MAELVENSVDDIAQRDKINKKMMLSLLDRIYDEKDAIIKDDNAMNIIVNSGYLASALCDAMDMDLITISLDGKEYSMARGSVLVDFGSFKDMIYEIVRGGRDDSLY